MKTKIKNIDSYSKYTTINISRKKLIEIMEESNENYFSNLGNNLKNNDKLIEPYISSLKEVSLYLNNFTFENHPYPDNCIISTNLLTKRQLILSDMIFEYIANDVCGNLSEIYHELYDFIYDYGNKDDNFSYIEFILLKKIITILTHKIQT